MSNLFEVPLNAKQSWALRWVMRARSPESDVPRLSCVAITEKTMMATNGVRIHKFDYMNHINPIPPGTYKVRLLTSKFAILSTLDNTPGMPVEVMEKLFQNGLVKPFVVEQQKSYIFHCVFNGKYISDATLGFDSAEFRFDEQMLLVRPNGSDFGMYYALIMAVNEVSGSNRLIGFSAP